MKKKETYQEFCDRLEVERIQREATPEYKKMRMLGFKRRHGEWVKSMTALRFTWIITLTKDKRWRHQFFHTPKVWKVSSQYKNSPPFDSALPSTPCLPSNC